MDTTNQSTTTNTSDNPAPTPPVSAPNATPTDSTMTTSTTTSTTTPGLPETGTGGDAAMNLLLFGVVALIIIAAGVYLYRRSAADSES